MVEMPSARRLLGTTDVGGSGRPGPSLNVAYSIVEVARAASGRSDNPCLLIRAVAFKRAIV